MNLPRLLVLCGVLVGLGGYVWYRNSATLRPTLTQPLPLEHAEIPSTIQPNPAPADLPPAPTVAHEVSVNQEPGVPSSPTQLAPVKSPGVSVNHVTLYLKNSGAVTGELVKQTDDAVTLRWDYGDVTFSRQEIQRIVRGREVEEEDDIVLPQSVQEARQWRYQHGVVFRLLNGNVLSFVPSASPPGKLLPHTQAIIEVLRCGCQ